MTEDIKKFGKIGSIEDATKLVRLRACYTGKDDDGEPMYDSTRELPTLTFEGTVKLHGSNAGIGIRYLHDGESDEIFFQSRNRFITVGDDWRQFAKTMTDNVELVTDYMLDLRNAIAYYDPEIEVEEVIVYGEWAGQGILGGTTGIANLPKAFYPFGVRVNDERYYDHRVLTDDWSRDDLIKPIKEFKSWTREINFNSPTMIGVAKNDIIELVEKVENECPVAAAQGFKGIGEGIVWRCLTDGYKDISFKSKGQKHSASNVKTLTPADIEKLGKLEALSNAIMTPIRLAQGLDWMAEMKHPVEKKSTGIYVKHVVSDAIAEEMIVIEKNGVEPRDLGKMLSRLASRFFVGHVDSL